MEIKKLGDLPRELLQISRSDASFLAFSGGLSLGAARAMRDYGGSTQPKPLFPPSLFPTRDHDNHPCIFWPGCSVAKHAPSHEPAWITYQQENGHRNNPGSQHILYNII
ncbi:hypothetical protein BB987_06195 [Photorhabdus temperata]|nr:hypothetical protein BB987_06195 [Photorhabdus temperata]